MLEKLTNEEIVEKLAKSRTVEVIIQNLQKRKISDLERDLSQDTYIFLLCLDNDLLNKLYNNGEINYYIVKVLKNNLYSKTSKFYHSYKKFDNITSNISDYNNL